ncbi:hypothetical protein PFISCL1PPCAC_28568, partial [Pristionchus fissidentatus]
VYTTLNEIIMESSSNQSSPLILSSYNEEIGFEMINNLSSSSVAGSDSVLSDPKMVDRKKRNIREKTSADEGVRYRNVDRMKEDNSNTSDNHLLSDDCRNKLAEAREKAQKSKAQMLLVLQEIDSIMESIDVAGPETTKDGITCENVRAVPEPKLPPPRLIRVSMSEHEKEFGIGIHSFDLMNTLSVLLPRAHLLRVRE